MCVRLMDIIDLPTNKRTLRSLAAVVRLHSLRDWRIGLLAPRWRYAARSPRTLPRLHNATEMADHINPLMRVAN